MMEEEFNLKYKQVCEVLLEGIPRPAVYIGYNDNHVFLARSLYNKSDLVVLNADKLKKGAILGSSEIGLTKSEFEYSKKILEIAGI